MAMASSTTNAAALTSSPLLSPVRSNRCSRTRVRAQIAMAATKVVPAIIVGGGRVGRALQDMGGGGDVLVKRGESVPVDFPGPIFVCTRNDDLDAVLHSTPQSRWKDLIFFQNGMLDPWLQSKGLKDADQVLAYFAVSKLGEPPVDGKTDTNPEGLTAAYGNWASAVSARLQAGGLSCKVLQKEAFQKQMLEKLIWISAFMLVGARYPGATVGAVEMEHRSELAHRSIQRFGPALRWILDCSAECLEKLYCCSLAALCFFKCLLLYPSSSDFPSWLEAGAQVHSEGWPCVLCGGCWIALLSA